MPQILLPWLLFLPFKRELWVTWHVCFWRTAEKKQKSSCGDAGISKARRRRGTSTSPSSSVSASAATPCPAAQGGPWGGPGESPANPFIHLGVETRLPGLQKGLVCLVQKWQQQLGFGRSRKIIRESLEDCPFEGGSNSSNCCFWRLPCCMSNRKLVFCHFDLKRWRVSKSKTEGGGGGGMVPIMWLCCCFVSKT